MLYIINNNQNFNIKNFTIYGERHSGTKLLQNLIYRNFNLPITWEYGFKHWFGSCDKNILKKAENTLFIGIVRNPYDWLMAMRKIPYHVPAQNLVSTNTFLFNEWYSVDDNNKEILEDRCYVTKKRYSNIFSMRSNKIKYLINYMPFLTHKYILLRYEDLVFDMDNIIGIINNFFRLTRKNKYIPIAKDTGYSIDYNQLNTINNSISWDTEKKIGYYEYKK